MRRIRKIVQHQLMKRGLQLTRLRFEDYQPIDLIGILAEREMARSKHFRVLQIGANDGITNDPLHPHIVKHGWATICVEPLPSAFASLIQTYAQFPNVACENCAVSNRDGSMTLYEVAGDDNSEAGYSRLASFSRDVVLKQKIHIPDIEQRIRSISVPARTIKSLLDQHGFDGVDLLQIDAEGYDFEIVKMAFNAGIRPTIVNFESQHLTFPEMRHCYELLSSNGYRTMSRWGDTIAYRDATNPPDTSADIHSDASAYGLVAVSTKAVPRTPPEEA